MGEILKRMDGLQLIDNPDKSSCKPLLIKLQHYLDTPVVGKTLCLTPNQAIQFECDILQQKMEGPKHPASYLG